MKNVPKLFIYSVSEAEKNKQLFRVLMWCVFCNNKVLINKSFPYWWYFSKYSLFCIFDLVTAVTYILHMNHSSFYRVSQKQAEKLKSREIKEGWMKNDKGWMKDDEGWMKNEEGWWFQAVEGFCFKTFSREDDSWLARKWIELNVIIKCLWIFTISNWLNF